MRRTVPALCLAVLLVTAGCSTVVEQAAPGEAAASAPGSDETVQVAATGSVTAEPNRAVVRLGVTATGESASEVRRRLDANASSMREALREAGVPADRITTVAYDIDRDRHRREGEPPYRARHTFLVRLNDTEGVGEIIVTAVENGATDVDDVRFTVTADRRQELRQRALEAAVESADRKAETIAGSADLELAGTASVRTADVHVSPYRQEAFTAAAAGDGGAPGISEGPVAVTAQVQVTYNATATGG